MLSNLVLPTFADLRLSTIQPVTVRKWVASLTDAGKAPATVRKAYQLLAGALDGAERDGLIPHSPARDVTLPRVEQNEMRFLEVSEVAGLAEAIAPRFRVLCS